MRPTDGRESSEVSHWAPGAALQELYGLICCSISFVVLGEMGVLESSDLFPFKWLMLRVFAAQIGLLFGLKLGTWPLHVLFIIIAVQLLFYRFFEWGICRFWKVKLIDRIVWSLGTFLMLSYVKYIFFFWVNLDIISHIQRSCKTRSVSVYFVHFTRIILISSMGLTYNLVQFTPLCVPIMLTGCSKFNW